MNSNYAMYGVKRGNQMQSLAKWFPLKTPTEPELADGQILTELFTATKLVKNLEEKVVKLYHEDFTLKIIQTWTFQVERFETVKTCQCVLIKFPGFLMIQ